MIIRLASSKPASSSSPAPGRGSQKPSLTIWISLALFFAVALAFSPILNNDFVNYDDGDYVTANPHVRQGMSLDTVVWAFGASSASNWHPLTWLSHALDCEFYDLKPWGHHLTSVLLHAANAALVFLLLQGLTGAVWRSAAAAALFGIHPAHVESVAWVSERKDVLSTFFLLLTLLAYLQYVRTLGPPDSRRKFWFRLTLALFVMGLMSKPMLVTLPFLLLLLDYWPLARVSRPLGDVGAPATAEQSTWRQLVVEKTPFFLAAAISCVVTYIVQNQGGAMRSMADLPLSARIANALVAYSRYLAELFFPARLSVYYPYPANGHWPGWQVALAALSLGFVSLPAIAVRRKRPYLTIGWLWFLGTLVPVIGLVQVGVQSMADRYTYIPSIGAFLALVWGVAELLGEGRRYRPFAWALAAVVSVICLPLTWRQIGYWKNGETLFRRALVVTGENCLPRYLLGDALFKQGRLEQAGEEFKKSINLRPNFADPHNDLGMIYSRENRHAEAVNQFETAIQAQAGYAPAHYNLGLEFMTAGRLDDALRQFEEAVRLKPDDADSHKNLGVALATKGRIDQAMVELKRAIILQPQEGASHFNLGILLGMKARFDDAIREFQAALALKPDYVEARNSLGIAFRAKDQLEDAAAQFRLVLKNQPGNPTARENLADVLAMEGAFAEAAENYALAIKVARDPARDHFQLGMVLLRLNRRDEAAGHFTEALKLRPNFPEAEQQLRALQSTASPSAK